jgi:predicted CopG family antitoxin
MYTYIISEVKTMKRTQIYLDDDIFEYLENESKIEHKSISEIIRESIRAKINFHVKDLVGKMNKIYGLWKDRDIEPDQYIRELRKDRKL